MPRPFNDLTGKVFGRLTAQWPEGRKSAPTAKVVIWLCACECGRLHHAQASHLLEGCTKSCGCWASEQKKTRCLTHGQSRSGNRTAEYRAYHRAKNDCTNPNNPRYPYYGGRGIQFLLPPFEEFFAFIGRKPTPQHSLDRFPDNDGPYALSNIRWATKKEQANNRRKAKPRTSSGST